MAITLQLAATLQKAAPSQSSGLPATAAAVDDTQAAALPFAAIMGELLRPQVTAAADVVATDVAEELVAETAPGSAQTPVDAATQALLASLAASPQTPVATPVATEAMPAADGASVDTAAQGTASAPVQDLLLSSQVATVSTGSTPAASDASAEAAPTFAGLIPAAAPEQNLPEAANIAAVLPDARTVRNGLERSLDEWAGATPSADASQLRQVASTTGGAPVAAHAQVQAAHYVIPEPVTSSRWADAISQRAMFMVDQQVQSAELHLNPPHLGPLEVKLALDGDKATLSFNTQQLAVREAVQQSLPKLHEVFAENGLSELNVQVHLGQQQQPQQQERQAGSRQYEAGDSPGGELSVEQTGGMSASRWRSQAYATARGGVDIFA